MTPTQDLNPMPAVVPPPEPGTSVPPKAGGAVIRRLDVLSDGKDRLWKRVAPAWAISGGIHVLIVMVTLFLFGGKKEEPKVSSPWAVNAPAHVASSTASGTKASMTDKVLKVADSAAKYAGVGDLAPTALKDQAVGGMNKAESGLSKGASGQD